MLVVSVDGESDSRATESAQPGVHTDSVGVVIPAYEPSIPLLESYVESLRTELAPTRIRIELDAPEAGVRERLEDIASVSVSTTRRGKGQAIMDGFDALETDVLVFADADGSVPASSVADIARRVTADGAALAIGSRRHPEATIVSHQTTGRRILGDAFALLARQLLPIACHDYQCGAKAIRSSVWEEVRPYCTESGFAWDIELVSMAAVLGHDVVEVPVEWRDHPDSTVDPVSTGIELARAVVDVRRRARKIAAGEADRGVDRSERGTGVNSGTDDH